MRSTPMAGRAVEPRLLHDSLASVREHHGPPPRGPCDAEFVALRDAYRSHGGIERGDDLARWLDSRDCGNFIGLARWIVAGEVFSFAWNDTFWIPMFQFDLATLALRPGARLVLAELAPLLDGWDLVQWFVRPHEALGRRRPLDLFESHLPAVLAVARTDRELSPR